jgi:MinD-like ATPase involved in chromosome partitioning or flagellar assembly
MDTADNGDGNKAKTRIIFSMGGKGGVGKTSVMASLVEWFDDNGIPVRLLDLDTENKSRGSLSHFHPGRAPKADIHTPAGLDAFIDAVSEGSPVVVADMGAGAGQVTSEWFDDMHPSASEAGIAFTAVGVVTDDPASVESVLGWAARLQNRATYLVVENALAGHSEFAYWKGSAEARQFREAFRPAVIRMGFRLPELENAVRNHGVTLGDVAGRSTDIPELRKSSLVMRAQSHRRRLSAEFDRVKELLLP